MEEMVEPESPSTSSNPMRKSRSIPRGATKPRAMAHALVAWLTALAPMARTLGNWPTTTARAMMEPTAWGLLEPDTLMTSSAASDMLLLLENGLNDVL